MTTTPFLKYYQELPDGMAPADVKNELDKVLAVAVNKDISVYDLCDALWQLADRQYHTYTHLDPETKAKIASWVEKNWITDQRFIGNLGMIGGAMGIRGIYDLLQSYLGQDLSPELKKEMEETLKELEPQIDDPYFDLK